MNILFVGSLFAELSAVFNCNVVKSSLLHHNYTSLEAYQKTINRYEENMK